MLGRSCSTLHLQRNSHFHRIPRHCWHSQAESLPRLMHGFLLPWEDAKCFLQIKLNIKALCHFLPFPKFFHNRHTFLYLLWFGPSYGCHVHWSVWVTTACPLQRGVWQICGPIVTHHRPNRAQLQSAQSFTSKCRGLLGLQKRAVKEQGELQSAQNSLRPWTIALVNICTSAGPHFGGKCSFSGTDNLEKHSTARRACMEQAEDTALKITRNETYLNNCNLLCELQLAENPPCVWLTQWRLQAH